MLEWSQHGDWQEYGLAELTAVCSAICAAVTDPPTAPGVGGTLPSGTQAFQTVKHARPPACTTARPVSSSTRPEPRIGAAPTTVENVRKRAQPG
ncbi:hypothetical protein GCM10009663_60470 [Kitasatospora arboriphila]|uniref:Uncharacterized protein n=1 Tax=Kitasatospora arboriphila TaxID=258052 RepID=A0ABN1U186_9ACTN